MAAPRKYPDELRERATRMALEALDDPARSRGAIVRVAEQLGVHREALRTWVRKLRLKSSTQQCGVAFGGSVVVEDLSWSVV